ncbi:MAG TPA: hypothetical protein VM076_24850 [Gemmatimonadaceae bacterium]|nr:hypothetical protein [Gemmatimonadaceae bacterium]
MSARSPTVLRLVLVATLTVSCARAGSEKARDSTAVVDSAVAQPVIPAPGSAPRDSATATPNARTPAATTPATPKSTPPTPTPTATPTATPSENVLTGRVVSGGLAAEPVTTLQVEGGKPMTLTGPLERELRRLNSATVWVAGAPGTPTTASPNGSFAVSRYEIVSINGVKPAVGSIVSRGGDVWLATERDTVKIVSAAADLRAKVGAKVWVVGRRSGLELTPQSFGVIREP